MSDLIYESVLFEGKAMIIGTPPKKQKPDLTVWQRLTRADVALGIYFYKNRYPRDYKRTAEELSRALADGLNKAGDAPVLASFAHEHTVDYPQLLKKFMSHIAMMEGALYMRYLKDNGFDEQEIDALQAIEKTLDY